MTDPERAQVVIVSWDLVAEKLQVTETRTDGQPLSGARGAPYRAAVPVHGRLVWASEDGTVWSADPRSGETTQVTRLPGNHVEDTISLYLGEAGLSVLIEDRDQDTGRLLRLARDGKVTDDLDVTSLLDAVPGDQAWYGFIDTENPPDLAGS